VIPNTPTARRLLFLGTPFAQYLGCFGTKANSSMRYRSPHGPDIDNPVVHCSANRRVDWHQVENGRKPKPNTQRRKTECSPQDELVWWV